MLMMVCECVVWVLRGVCCWSISNIFFFKQKTAYEMRISDWSSDVCSSDLALLKLIALATNLFWFGRFSTAHAAITDASVGLAVVAIPVVGGLLIGLMARFGSDKIRGLGIPEAIEAILYDQSRLSPKVAILKPISSAISIGSGGPNRKSTRLN